jgi:hypothetical protein
MGNTYYTQNYDVIDTKGNLFILPESNEKFGERPIRNGMFEFDSSKRWFKNDLLHREDGHAVENANGNKMWYLEGFFIYSSENGLDKFHSYDLDLPESFKHSIIKYELSK